MKRFLAVVAIAAVSAGFAACGGSGDEPSAAQDTPAAATAAVAGAVSANSASEEQLAAAFTAAGVQNAAKWADEVVEYRPYPADDTTFAKLRGELAKYNPAPDQLEKIIGALVP